MLNTIIMRHDGYGEKPVQSTMEDMPPIELIVLDHIITNNMSGVLMEFPGKHRRTGKERSREALSYYKHDPMLYYSSKTIPLDGKSSTMITTLDDNTWSIFKKYIKTKDSVILYSKDYNSVVFKRDYYRFSYQDIFEIPNLIIYAKHLT